MDIAHCPCTRRPFFEKKINDLVMIDSYALINTDLSVLSQAEIANLRQLLQDHGDIIRFRFLTNPSMNPEL